MRTSPASPSCARNSQSHLRCSAAPISANAWPPPATMHCNARRAQHGIAVMAQTSDGGYWLIGLRRFDAALFTDVPWGSAAVLGMTLQRLRDLRWRWHLLTERSDIDRPADLDSLPAALRV